MFELGPARQLLEGGCAVKSRGTSQEESQGEIFRWWTVANAETWREKPESVGGQAPRQTTVEGLLIGHLTFK